MKIILTSILAGTLLASLLTAQTPTYILTDLGPAGNPYSLATFVTNTGLITGAATASDGSQHAVLWRNGLLMDISSPGLGGPNSGAGAANELGQILGGAETAGKDPNNENFCGYGTGLQCVAVLWDYFGTMTPLPTLGGPNGGYGGINNRGQVAGYAENNTRDHGCRPGVAVNGTGPQALDFEAVIWGPRWGEMRELQPLSGDTVGMAFGINDAGRAVGTSGTCGNTVLPGFAAGPHAVLWDSDGQVHDLGSLGGTANPGILAVGTVAFAINNPGEVTGIAALSGNVTGHPFLWRESTGMMDLGLLPGDVIGAGLAINNAGDVVGASISAPGAMSGNPSAVLWRNGVINDLNNLIPANSPLYLLTADAIDDLGEIAGFGITGAGEIHAFLATPNHGLFGGDSSTGAPAAKRPAIPENVRRMLQQGLAFGRLGGRLAHVN